MSSSDWRVSAEDVKEILDTDLSNTVIGAFINAANITVTKLLGSKTALSEEQRIEIERWLSAHLIACTKDHQAKSEAAGDASVTYQGQTEMALDSTHYGQMVKFLDTTGTLAAKDKKQAAMIYAVPSFE